jgi:hypothetical protein
MSKNVPNISMLMLPNKRYDFAILVLECILSDYPTIGTNKIVLCGPATEIELHFEFSSF